MPAAKTAFLVAPSCPLSLVQGRNMFQAVDLLCPLADISQCSVSSLLEWSFSQEPLLTWCSQDLQSHPRQDTLVAGPKLNLSSELNKHGQYACIHYISMSQNMYGMFLPFQLVQERLLCCGIVGKGGCSEVIMSVDVTCHFIAPMLNISPKQLNFYIQKVGQRITNRIFNML